MMQYIRKALPHTIRQCSANKISQCTSDACSADDTPVNGIWY